MSVEIKKFREGKTAGLSLPKEIREFPLTSTDLGSTINAVISDPKLLNIFRQTFTLSEVASEFPNIKLEDITKVVPVNIYESNGPPSAKHESGIAMLDGVVIKDNERELFDNDSEHIYNSILKILHELGHFFRLRRFTQMESEEHADIVESGYLRIRDPRKGYEFLYEFTGSLYEEGVNQLKAIIIFLELLKDNPIIVKFANNSIELTQKGFVQFLEKYSRKNKIHYLYRVCAILWIIDITSKKLEVPKDEVWRSLLRGHVRFLDLKQVLSELGFDQRELEDIDITDKLNSSGSTFQMSDVMDISQDKNALRLIANMSERKTPFTTLAEAREIGLEKFTPVTFLDDYKITKDYGGNGAEIKTAPNSTARNRVRNFLKRIWFST